MDIRKDILWRVYLSFLCIGVLGILIAGKTFYIQQVQGSYWKGLSDSLHLEYREMDADRGTIYSEDGSMLSSSIPFFDVRIDFGADGLREKDGIRFRQSLDSLSKGLASLFRDKPATQYKAELQKGFRRKDRYYLLKRKISFRDYQRLRELPLVRLGSNKSGFILEDHEKRLMPFGLLANRTIGLSRAYLDSGRRSVSKNVGLERTYDSVLKGVTGKRLVRRIAGGAYIPVEGSEIEPVNGKDIITTLDINVQDITQAALMRMMRENEALEGCAVMMEVSTGKIKGIANLSRIGEGQYAEADNFALRTSEPGSTIKLITLLAVLEDGYATIRDRIDIGEGSWMLRNRRIQDAEKTPKTHPTLKEAFEHSSNVAMSKLAYFNYIQQPQRFIGHYQDLQLNRKSGIDLNEEFRPLVKDPASKSWHLQTLASMGFGYEVMLTPLQLLTVYNAVANEGRMVKPYLVNRIEKDGILHRQFEPVIRRDKICSDETLAQLKECLEAVCLTGTAKTPFRGAAYTVAGKTGTAKVNDGTFKYNDGVYQSSFVGYFPADRPRYSCIVVIKNKPHAAKYFGGAVAAPVFREIADKVIALQQGSPAIASLIPFDSSAATFGGGARDIRIVLNGLNLSYQDSSSRSLVNADWQNTKLVMKDRILSTDTMPSLKGLTLKDALVWLESRGMIVEPKGKGKVTEQFPTAGTMIRKQQKVKIVLQ